MVAQKHWYGWPAIELLSSTENHGKQERTLLTARWLMLHLFLKARQDTGNCMSAWVIPGRLPEAAQGLLDKKTALPSIQKEVCSLPRAHLAQVVLGLHWRTLQDRKPQLVQPCSYCLVGMVPGATYPQSLLGFVSDPVGFSKTETEVIYSFALTPFTDQHWTSLTSATLFNRAEEPLCWPCRHL